jgi:hypothetical protein
MKYQAVFIILLLSAFISFPTAFAQSAELPNPDDLKNVVITMKQEPSRGWGGGVSSGYTVTLTGDGTVVFDGMDEGHAISKYEPAVKVVRRYPISKAQFKELVNEFYKIDFFSLKNEYQIRDNGDGTLTVIEDGGLATVITSIAINGKTKTVTNINFAPEKLIELQRKIYAVASVARFVKLPPYWLLKFPNQQFPPRLLRELYADIEPAAGTPKAVYRKIQRSSPKGNKERRIDLDKRWGFIKPCITTKAEVEKILGNPINIDVGGALPTYNLKNEKIRVFYSSEKTDSRICNDKTDVGTVILFSVIPIKDTKLSELKIDLTKFKKEERFYGREKSYRNEQAGIFIETEIVQFSDERQIEMVTSIQFSQKHSEKKVLK